MFKALVFATAYIDSNINRYQSWIDYYQEFFADQPVELILINDGPCAASLNLGSVKLLTFEKHLGRKSVNVFPGWKRSFHRGIQYARQSGYHRIGHVESDCGITYSGRQSFINCLLRRDGYFTGYCKAYSFPETALQVINAGPIIDFYLKRYQKESSWYENISFEDMVKKKLRPAYILDGDRANGKAKKRIKPHYTFFTGLTLDKFKEIYPRKKEI